MIVRSGIGWDVHPLVAGRKLVLGGVIFEGTGKGLEGHSDGDVVCHAVCDAVLGALSLGDIGEMFPDTDPRYKDYESSRFLEVMAGLVRERGFTITGVDCTVMSEEIHLGERKKAMAAKMAERLGVDRPCVNVKATRWEGHGSVGRGEVIACLSIVTLMSV